MEEQAEDKASFCLATGVAPSEYDKLTALERRFFIKVHNKNNKK